MRALFYLFRTGLCCLPREDQSDGHGSQALVSCGFGHYTQIYCILRIALYAVLIYTAYTLIESRGPHELPA